VESLVVRKGQPNKNYVKLLTESFPGIHQHLVQQKRFVLLGEQTKRFLRFSQSHEKKKPLLWKPAAFLPLTAWWKLGEVKPGEKHCENLVKTRGKPGEHRVKLPKPGENLVKFPKPGENLVKLIEEVFYTLKFHQKKRFFFCETYPFWR
jgi:hypothetical protein